MLKGSTLARYSASQIGGKINEVQKQIGFKKKVEKLPEKYRGILE